MEQIVNVFGNEQAFMACSISQHHRDLYPYGHANCVGADL
jgi:hypothetical protein